MIPEKAIRGFFKSHHPFIDDSDLPRRAEVALVLDVSLDNNDPNILFIQRAECEKDPWSGQMAFPGGRRETTDLVDGDAARRETAEEIGLELGAAQLIGRLNDMRGRHGGRSADLMISCFVFVTDQIEQLALNHEVADVMHAHQHERGGEVYDVMHALTESRRVPNTPHRWPPFSISRHNG